MLHSQFCRYLAGTMNAAGVNPRKDMKLRTGIFGAEPWSDRTRQRINAALGIDAFDIYGLTELCGPGVSVECPEHNGLHIWEDHFIVETIDPETNEVLPDGEEGNGVHAAVENWFAYFAVQNPRHLSYRNRHVPVQTHPFTNDAGERQVRRHAHYTRRQRVSLTN
jgi:acyl-CoA synthetase (AMP-forming)/AMP-acid ligase II